MFNRKWCYIPTKECAFNSTRKFGLLVFNGIFRTNRLYCGI